jgi:hypothetical protein
VVLALTVAVACGQLGTDLDQIVALDVLLPDSGRMEVNDTLRPTARALNGRGDPVLAQIFWSSLDSAILTVVDDTTGVTLADSVGTGRLQARVGSLRSNLLNVFVLPHLDTAYAVGDTVSVVNVALGDSLSDSLVVQVAAPSVGTNPLASRRVAYAAAIYPPGGATFTFVPGDTVKTTTAGIAAAQLRFTGGTPPDSVVVTATLRRLPPIVFVVEFQP